MTNKIFLEDLGFKYDTYGNFKFIIEDIMIDVCFGNYDLEGTPDIEINELPLPVIKDWKPFVSELMDNTFTHFNDYI